MTVDISELNSSNMPAWDAFVDACPTATFFHRSGWKTILERVFRHHTHYLMAKEDGAIVGVLPLAELRSQPVWPSSRIDAVLRLRWRCGDIGARRTQIDRGGL